jgi:hypothetical protein
MSRFRENAGGWMREQGEGEQSLKHVQHRCGYPLRAQVLTYLEGVDGQRVVVVAYHGASDEACALPLYWCPQCGKRLRLWWTVDG